MKMYLRHIRHFTKTTAPTHNLAREKRIKIGKYYINYIKVGSGPHNVIMTPGALGTIWTNYKSQIIGFDKEKFTIVAWDPPGYGKSYPLERDFNRQSYEKDADTAYELMKYLQIPKYSCMGWSGGGSATYILAVKYPEAINKLVIWGAHSSILPDEIETFKNMRDIKTWSPGIRDAMINVYGEKKLVEYWGQWVDGMVATFQPNPDICSSYIKDITCPTLLLHGLKDPLMNYLHVKNLCKQIKNLRTHFYPEGVHYIHIQYAQDFNKRVQEFLLQPE